VTDRELLEVIRVDQLRLSVMMDTLICLIAPNLVDFCEGVHKVMAGREWSASTLIQEVAESGWKGEQLRSILARILDGKNNASQSLGMWLRKQIGHSREQFIVGHYVLVRMKNEAGSGLYQVKVWGT
jgi:hypothetical protein